jgi:hypothetical protein
MDIAEVQLIARERMVLQWANEMVMRWACAVIGDRWVIVIVIFNDCRSDAVGADVVGIVFEGRLRGLNFLGIPNDDGFVDVNQGGMYLCSRKSAQCWWREQCNLVR